MFSRATLALALCLPLPAVGAPVPPPPALTAESLVGEWRYAWGERRDGRITFQPDGTYRAHHEPDGPRYVGSWRLYGATVTLTEYVLHRETGDPCGPNRYEFDLSARDWPTLAGRTPGGVAVVLSEPQR